MKCQNLFSGKNKKNISICLLKILPEVLSFKSSRQWKGDNERLCVKCSAVTIYILPPAGLLPGIM